MKEYKKQLLSFGLFNLISPLPLMVLSIFFVWFIEFGIGYRLYGVHNTPDWLLYSAFLPLLISPLCALTGIVRGIVRRKEKHALTCAILSAVGLLENVSLFAGIMYLSATF